MCFHATKNYQMLKSTLSDIIDFALCVLWKFLVDVELHPNGIAPIFKKCIKSFCMHKLNFFLQYFFLYRIYSLGGYNRNKTRPMATTNPILRKWVRSCVGAIPSKPKFLPFSSRLLCHLIVKKIICIWFVLNLSLNIGKLEFIFVSFRLLVINGRRI